MHIVFQHPNAVPVQTYGGTERILYWIMRYLASLGHQVDFIGPKDSTLPALSLDKINHIVQTNKDWRFHLPKTFDCVHLFYPQDGLEQSIPIVFTVGGNGKQEEIFPKNTVFVSKSHANNHKSESFVYNGIDLSEYPFSGHKSRAREWKNFLFLAKASWSVKNLKGCIKAIRSTNKVLHIAGGRSLWSLFSKQIQSYGMVNQKQKETIIHQCDALLFPVLWNEPFGLAMIEAMAYGIPVIGTNSGSLPEIIRPQTGIIIKNQHELVTAIKDDSLAQKFDAQTLRSYVEDNFSHEHMACNYLKLYEKIQKGEFLQEENPRTLC